MAEKTSVFDEYIVEGSKLSDFKELFQSLESMGKGFSKVKGAVSDAINLKPLDSLKDKFKEISSVNDKITDGLKKLGLSEKSIALLNKTSGGLLSKADPFIMSLYGSVETFASTVLQDVISSVLAKVYIPEEVFLVAVKGLAAAKSDPNYNNTLRETALTHDLVNTIKWLDDYNNITYTIEIVQASDAVRAAKSGSFHVAAYIIGKLKETYDKIKAVVSITDEEESAKMVQMTMYESFFNNIIKLIFVYSYDNLTVGEFEKIIRGFPSFKPSAMGSTDSKYGKRAMVTELDIVAPIKKYETLETMWNSRASDKVFIIPRNNNIKKIYVMLAFSSNYNEEERLVNKPLHDRLKYKILSTAQEALFEAQKSLLNSPLGKYISDMKGNYLSLIAKYTREVERFLFDPKKQDMLTGEDNITLPDFKPPLSNDKENFEKTLEKSLPRPAGFAKNNISFDDFHVYYVDPDYTQSRIAQDIVAIVRTSGLKYMTTHTIYSKKLSLSQDDDNINANESQVENLFFILHNEKFNTSILEDERDRILEYVTVKYIVDAYTGKGYELEVLAAMFPSLNNNGILNEFEKYIKALKAGNDSGLNGGDKNELEGINRPIEDISFYTQVLNLKGESIKIDPTGINTYDIFGKKISSFTSIKGSPAGISVIGDDIYVLSYNKLNELEVSYSSNGGVDFIKVSNVDESDVSMYPGVGITSVDLINFYESFYYDNTLFIISDNKLLYSEDKTNFIEVDLEGLVRGNIMGISILPNGDMYILSSSNVYRIGDFKTSLDSGSSFDIQRIKEYDESKNRVIKGVPGSIINAVSIPVDTIDDFDIDDKAIINKILVYYSSTRFMYYWYIHESN
jgi:hypothetical protein